MDFRSLQHLQDSAIHFSRAFQARYGPRSGFGYPLRGFRPPNPGRLFFTPAALVGFALRSVLLRRGNRSVSARLLPLAVCPVSKRPARSRGPARRAAASGVCPASESLATGRCLARRPLVAPVGFSLTGFARHRLGRVLPGLLSHASRLRILAGRTCQRLRVSIGDDLFATVDRDPSRAAAKTLAGFPRRYVPQHSLIAVRLAYCFASCRVVR